MVYVNEQVIKQFKGRSYTYTLATSSALAFRTEISRLAISKEPFPNNWLVRDIGDNENALTEVVIIA